MRSTGVGKRDRIHGARGKSGRGGFTLLELALVILVLSILFAIIFGVYYNISRIISGGTRGIDQERRAALALEDVRDSINRTFYDESVHRLIFVGTKGDGNETRKDRLTFASVNPGAEYLGVAAVRELSFYVKSTENGNEGTLMRREDEMVDEQPGEGGAHYPILPHVVSFVLRYSRDGTTWNEEWSSLKTRKVPLLVQIQIRVVIDGKIRLYESLANPGITRQYSQ